MPEAGEQWQRSRQEAQVLANQAIEKETLKDHHKALELYTEAAHAHLELLKVSKGTEWTLLRNTCDKLLKRAEKMKEIVEEREKVLDTGNVDKSVILERSSMIDGLEFPIWNGTSTFADLSLNDSQSLESPDIDQYNVSYGPTDDVEWVPTSIALPEAIMIDPTFNINEKITQGSIADCSFVASLIVCSQHNQNFGTRLAIDALYPQDKDGIPQISSNGVYQIRLYVNGTCRKITVNDKLPVSTKSRELQCSTSTLLSTPNISQLWAPLLEKAYMKWSGGSRFRGSLSSIDIFALCGWIPEHIQIHSSDFQREKLWKRIYSNFHNGHCVLTIGTGHMKPELLQSTGLIATHQYAVLDLFEDADIGTRHVYLVNPWRHQSILAGLEKTSSIDSSSSSSFKNLGAWTDDIRKAIYESQTGDSNGIFALDWDVICSYFDSIFINWNPNLYKFQKEIHSGLQTNKTAMFSLHSKVENREYGRNGSEDDIDDTLVLLTRHTKSRKSSEEYIMLHSYRDTDYNTDHSRISNSSHLVDLKHIPATFVDTSSVLARLDTELSRNAKLIVSYRGEDFMRYTLQFFSKVSINLEEIRRPNTFIKTIDGSWGESSAGGNASFPTFLNNPQYCISIPVKKESTTVDSISKKIFVSLNGSKGLSMNVKVVKSNGGRVSAIKQKDIIADSGSYSHGTAIAEVDFSPELSATTTSSSYTKTGDSSEEMKCTLVVSTFSPRQEGDYQLIIESTMQNLQIFPIPTEGAGMYKRKLNGDWKKSSRTTSSSRQGGKKVIYHLSVPRTTKFIIRLQRLNPVPSNINVEIFGCKESESGIGQRVFTTDQNDAIADHPTGVCTELITLSGNSNGYYVIPSTHSAINSSPEFSLFIYSESPITVKEV